MGDILTVYATITRQDYRVLRDNHEKEIDSIKGPGKEKEADQRFERVTSEFIRENEEDLLRSLRGDLEKTLQRISPSTA